MGCTNTGRLRPPRAVKIKRMPENGDFENLSEEPQKPGRPEAGILVEDVLIILSTVGLFVCWIFRHRHAAQIGLWAILTLMIVVFIRRQRRFRRAFSRKPKQVGPKDIVKPSR